MLSSKNYRLYSSISSSAENQGQTNGHIQTTKELIHSNARKSTELVPIWKVYGFLQDGGGISKDSTELHHQIKKQKQLYCIHSNQVSPHEWPSTSSSSSSSAQSEKSTDNQTKTSTVQQKTWTKRLMHRTRSAIM